MQKGNRRSSAGEPKRNDTVAVQCYALACAKELLAQSPEEMLAQALQKSIDRAVGMGDYSNLINLAGSIANDLHDGNIGCFTAKEKERRFNNKIADESDGDYEELNGPITQGQIGYIAGLTKQLNLDRYDLPRSISPESDYKDLTEGQAIKVIDTLLKMKEDL